MPKCSTECEQMEPSSTQKEGVTKGSCSWDDKVESTFRVNVTHHVHRLTRKLYHPINRCRKARQISTLTTKVSANQEQKGTSSNWQGHLPEAPAGSLMVRLSPTHDRTRWGWAPHHACCHCPEVLAKQARKKTKYSNRKEGMTLAIRRRHGFGVQSLTKRLVGLNGEASKGAGNRSTYKYQSHSHTTRVKKQNV